jgi:outer membrane protein assembly factor BamB
MRAALSRAPHPAADEKERRMPGNGKVFVSYAPEDAQVCLPLFAALDAWEVDYHAAPATLDPAQQIPPAVQRDIAERDVFIRVCSPAAQHSIPMNLQVSVYRALQAGEGRGSRRTRRALINLILVPGYVREPFDNATIFIDATNRPRQDWLNELGRALGVTLLRSRLSRRAVVGLGVAGVATVASLSAGGIFLLDYQARTQRPKRTPGQVVWKKQASDKAIPNPAIVGDVIYTVSETGVYAFRITDGHQLWRAAISVKSLYGAPVVNGSVLYVSLDNAIYALNTSTGAKRWSVALDTLGTTEDLAGGPTYFDGVLYTISTFGSITARSASDGKKRWSQSTTATPTNEEVISTPVADASGIYFASRDHNCYALDKATGAVKWNYLTRGPIHSSPAVANGVVYVGGEDTYVYALKARDGSLLWRFKTERDIISSPVVAGGAVYIGSNDQYLYALDAKTGALFWRSPAGDISSTGVLLGEEIHGLPSVEGGVVAVRANETYYCFNVTDGSRRWRFKPGEGGDQEQSDIAVGGGVACFGFRKDHLLYVLGA